MEGFPINKKATMTFRVEHDLRDSFKEATERNRIPAAQVLRAFMRDYVQQARNLAPAISPAERKRREKAVNYARASVGLEGFKIGKAEEQHARRVAVFRGEDSRRCFCTGWCVAGRAAARSNGAESGGNARFQAVAQRQAAGQGCSSQATKWYARAIRCRLESIKEKARMIKNQRCRTTVCYRRYGLPVPNGLSGSLFNRSPGQYI